VISHLRIHFRPFTEVMRRIEREVTRKFASQAWTVRTLSSPKPRHAGEA